MPSLKIRIAKQDLGYYGDGPLPRAAKEVLTAILADDDRAVPAPPAAGTMMEAVTIWISEEQKAQLEDLQRIYRGFDSIGPLATGLLLGRANRERAHDKADLPEALPAREPTTLDRLNAALGNQTRGAQEQLFTRLHKALKETVSQPPVIAAEAATGVGKTRVFLASMLDWTAKHPDASAVLTAPSYNVLLQAVTLWHRLRTVLPETPDAVTLLGQSEYVSATALERILADLPDDTPGKAAAAQWLAGKGAAAADDPLGHPWLMRSLQAACSGAWGFSAQVQVDTSTPESDPGRMAYQQQFALASEAPWVFCTHAMLATDVRRRIIQARRGYKADSGASASQAAWAEFQAMEELDRKGTLVHELQNDLVRDLAESDAGRLPPIGLLVVDEAHLLEENFARLFATGVSIAGLLRTLKELQQAMPRKITGTDLQDIKDAWALLRDIGRTRAGEQLMAERLPGAMEAATAVRNVLKRILARKLPANEEHRSTLAKLREVSRSLELASISNQQRGGMTTRVSWSPSEQWPSIEVGRYDVSAELDFLWTVMVEDRSVLVSATLYEDVTRDGQEGIRRLLSIRSGRLTSIPPVRPPWIFEPVQLYMPADSVTPDRPKDQQRFYRPTDRSTPDPEKRRIQTIRWRKEIARYVLQAYASGEGGMLVLMTSHAERQALEVAIAERLPPGALITQTPSIGLELAKHRFLQATALGLRPCLLAVGSAWTGLDISGDALANIIGRPVPPEEDRVLTDLVIPNAPIGVNRTLTHQWRRERIGTLAEIGAVSMLFRQGIGRLVRREGLPHKSRRLHFLDARIYDPAMGQFFASIKRALTAYGGKKFV